MPNIYISDVVYAEIRRRMAAVQTTAEGVIVAAIEQTSPQSTAEYYRRRFYLVTPEDAGWIARQNARVVEP